MIEYKKSTSERLKDGEALNDVKQAAVLKYEEFLGQTGVTTCDVLNLAMMERPVELPDSMQKVLDATFEYEDGYEYNRVMWVKVNKAKEQALAHVWNKHNLAERFVEEYNKFAPMRTQEIDNWNKGLGEIYPISQFPDLPPVEIISDPSRLKEWIRVTGYSIPSKYRQIQEEAEEKQRDKYKEQLRQRLFLEKKEQQYIDRIIYDHLSYQDCDFSDNVKRDKLIAMLDYEPARKYAKTLSVLLDIEKLRFHKPDDDGFDYKPELVLDDIPPLEDVIDNLLWSCNKALRDLGILSSPYASSRTWAYWDIAKQETYFIDQSVLDSGYSKEYIPDHWYNKLNEILNRHIGWEVYLAWHSGQREQLEKHNFPPGTLELLNKQPKEKVGTLSSVDLAELGRLINWYLDERSNGIYW